MGGDILLGIETAFSWSNLLYCFIGVSLGMVVGVLPGIGVLSAISMLFPITFYLDPTTALIMLAGIWYGTGYGGRTASILLNIPGSVANAVTCLDGYPMTRQGRGGVALFLTTIASFVGGTLGIVLLMALAPLIADFALHFSSPEYFSLMLLGLIAASTISDGSVLKALAMVILGIMLGGIGTDIYTASLRYTFGQPSLMEGLSLIALAMGLFGVAEVIQSLGAQGYRPTTKIDVSMKAMRPSKDDISRSWAPMLRGSAIGSFFGTLPGTGPSVASFLSYAVEKRVSSTPERFGHGAVEGIMAPEAADNAAEMTSFIPTLSLGIPGSATMALMLGVLMIHGITPGPALTTEQPALFWGLIMSFWIGNVILLFLNIPMIGLWVRMLTIPYHLLFPAVLMLICIGTYSVNNSTFDVWLVVVFGAIGWGMRWLDLPAAPVLLGFVLGPMIEEHFRRAMLQSRGDFVIFLERPISAILIAISAGILLWGIVKMIKSPKGLGANTS